MSALLTLPGGRTGGASARAPRGLKLSGFPDPPDKTCHLPPPQSLLLNIVHVLSSLPRLKALRVHGRISTKKQSTIENDAGQGRRGPDSQSVLSVCQSMTSERERLSCQIRQCVRVRPSYLQWTTEKNSVTCQRDVFESIVCHDPIFSRKH